ncbi:membrane dipeptidase [Vibrio crassostreae]|uniref:Putative Membrane dipeptidase n=1 Tax=Vibrio crassostreae TaxID=246167 RepID=A0A822MTH3_9VIBR|nr:membrane dipeptidase [Vibrio crassostreae]MDH5950242.1 dipeptidase [Vibrio crassostreae]RPF18622.1 microsomal dipeptidase-like Zn-dependent dipeptidase [Vibrio crassostreae]TCN06648.1 microsomal dipeptidase-like Zn-dependent dipeptidase [Vibrio crassostreae]TCN90036.1 microsomal dipeptidase-like Zn-dependent dipeptidase [Vibrio crassostreae]TCU06123.1 microsomal dipeptidase-like Zn-dependent dipeptidase [Vibrio crassostreae]
MKLSQITIALTASLSMSVFAHDIGHEHEHVDGGWNSKAGFVSDVDYQANLFNTRGKDEETIIKRSIWLAEKYDLKRTPEQVARANKARRKYEKAIAINSILPSSVGIIGNTHDNFTKAVKRNQDAGITLASATVYAFPGSLDEGVTAYDVIAASDEVVAEQNMKKVDTADDIRSAKREGSMAVMYNTQGADFVAEDMDYHAHHAYEKGIRTMNFTYNNNNMLAGGGTEQNLGLTELGQEWVTTAQSNNIVVDVSHSSNQAAIEAAKVATKPIIASHSNAKGLWDVSRNISDEAIRAIGSTGGAICPTGVGMFLNKEADASPERYVEHVVYIADMIGKDKVCFSTDYVHNILDYYKRDIANTDVYPPELGFGAPISNIAAENIWDVAAILEDKYGWNEKEVLGFLGENLMRVYQANWKV